MKNTRRNTFEYFKCLKLFETKQKPYVEQVKQYRQKYRLHLFSTRILFQYNMYYYLVVHRNSI